MVGGVSLVCVDSSPVDVFWILILDFSLRCGVHGGYTSSSLRPGLNYIVMFPTSSYTLVLVYPDCTYS